MVKNKRDRRVQKTQLLLKNTLVSLLEEIPLHRIHISELCQRCQLNRATFYAHYADLYDLVDAIEQDILEELEKIMADPNPPFLTSAEIGNRFFSYLYENRRILRVLLLNDSGFRFASQLNRVLTNLLRDSVSHRYRIPEDFPTERVEGILRFIVFGHYSYYMRFLFESDSFTTDGISSAADLCAHLSECCLQEFFKEKES